MNRAQQKLGNPSPLVVHKIFPALNEMIQEFVRTSPFAVLSTADSHGNCYASPKGGAPGFVKVIDEKHLLLPDVSGNNLFQSYENIETNPKAALLFVIPGCDWSVRVNGRVSVIEKINGHLAGIAPETLSREENARAQQALMIDVEEAYAQCPRSFSRSKLWDVDQIRATREKDANAYWLERWKVSMAGRM